MNERKLDSNVIRKTKQTEKGDIQFELNDGTMIGTNAALEFDAATAERLRKGELPEGEELEIGGLEQEGE